MKYLLGFFISKILIVIKSIFKINLSFIGNIKWLFYLCEYYYSWIWTILAAHPKLTCNDLQFNATCCEKLVKTDILHKI